MDFFDNRNVIIQDRVDLIIFIIEILRNGMVVAVIE